MGGNPYRLHQIIGRIKMNNCPECNSENIIQIGDNHACMDCDWDDLPKLEEDSPSKLGFNIHLMVRNLAGFEIIESVHLVEKRQFRFPRSKKKRIKKKWAKQDKNYKYFPQENYYIIGNKIICHPIIAQAIYSLVSEYEEE